MFGNTRNIETSPILDDRDMTIDVNPFHTIQPNIFTDNQLQDIDQLFVYQVQAGPLQVEE
jgi:hypothetical protein